MRDVGTVTGIGSLVLIAAIVGIPSIAVLWSASVLSRTPGERCGGLALGIFGAVAPYAAARLHLLDFLPKMSIWFPQSNFDIYLRALCAAGISTAFAAFGATVGVWSGRLLGRLLR